MSLLTYTLSLLLALGTTQPTTTAPATTQPLSAKQTLVAAHRAMIDANMLAVLSLYSAIGADQEKVAHGCAANAVAVAQLEKVTRLKFGENTAELVLHKLGLPTTAEIDNATETITQNSAIIRYPTRDVPPLTLTRIDGQWKVPIANMVKGMKPLAINRACENTNELTRQIGWTAEQVSQDKIKTPDDLKEAVDRFLDLLNNPQ